MRAPFNTTCELFAGPSTLTPGVSRGVFPCRHVLEHGIHSQQLDPGQPKIPAYMTISGYRPKGIFTTPSLSIAPGLADRVSIPAGSFPHWIVFYTDFIRWKGQARYYRSYLIDETSYLAGGLVLGGLAIIEPPHIVTPQGIVCDGHAPPILLTLPDSILLGGAAIVTSATPLYLSGGVLIGGIAITVPPGQAGKVGGILLGGNANVVPGKPFVISGGVLVGGAAIAVPGKTYFPKGGLLLGGVATVVPWPIAILRGGVLTGGQGSWSTNVVGGSVLSLTTQPPAVEFIVLSSPFSGLSNGDTVVVAGCTRSPLANGTWTAASVFTIGSEFVLAGSNGTTSLLGPEPSAYWYKL